MNKALTRIFCLFMAFQVLFASTGFAMYEHYCKIKGWTTYSLSTPKKSCCSIENLSSEQSKKSSLKKAKCCSDQVSFYKISPNASQGYKVDIKNHLPAYIPTSVIAFIFAQASETISKNNLLYSNSSPHFSGRNLLNFLQSFLI